MKISKLIPWIIENKVNIIGTTVIITMVSVFIIGMACIARETNEREKLLPVGTDVIVKGTTIRGTVTEWQTGNTVIISFVEKDGTIKTLAYNYTLLKRQ